MGDKRKTLIFFDVGSVLIELNFKNFIDNIEKRYGVDFKSIREEYSSIEKDSMDNSLSEEEFIKEFSKLINSDVSREEMINNFSYAFGSEIKEVIELKRILFDSGYSVGILSNINSLAYDFINSRYPQIFEVFDKGSPRIFSYIEGFNKPEKELYEGFEEYDKIIFIDDKESYLRTGIEGFGWKGILFTSYIDKNEPVRLFHNSERRKTDKFLIADNYEELVNCLEELEIVLPKQNI